MKVRFNSGNFFFGSLILLLLFTFVLGYFDKDGISVLRGYGQESLFSPDSEEIVLEEAIDSETIHNNFPGNTYHTRRYPKDYIHNEFPGNFYHTMRYQPGWQHNNHQGSGGYTNRYPGDHTHNDAPGSLFHTDYYPPGWQHNHAPDNPLKHTSRSPAPKHLDRPGWWQHTHLHTDGPRGYESWYRAPNADGT